MGDLMKIRFHTGRALGIIRIRWKKIVLVFASFLVGLLIAEAIVALAGLDWRIISRMLSYQNADSGSHAPVDNPDLIYRLKPGFTDYNNYTVTVNDLGFRDPPRSVKKPEGVFRIICYGGSNVYGLGLADDATWPRRLEETLNGQELGARFEVWNAGVCAWVPSQMTAAAKIDYEKYDPDLIMLCLSNGGAPPFLYGSNPKPYFDAHPKLWADFFTPDCMAGPARLSYRQRLFAVKHSRLLRYGAVAAITERKECLWHENYRHELKNQKRTASFLAWAKDRVDVCLFLYPGCKENMGHYKPYLDDIQVPVLKLSADGLPLKFMNIHPDAPVADWYAKEISEWLVAAKLLPATSP